MLRLVLILLAVTLPGCASIFFNDYKQVVRVMSDPPGAEIYNQNGEKLGVTPAYVKIRRSEGTQIKLQLPTGELKSVSLEGYYRWSPSFYGNLAFFSLAPIGWGVDYLTKTAYEYHDPGVVQFRSQQRGKIKTGPLVEVVAPPQSEWNLLSREVADMLVEYLKERHPTKYIKDYKDTRGDFAKYHYSYDRKAEGEELNKILYTVDADQYVESIVTVVEPNVRIRVSVKDAYTHEIIQSFVLERPTSQFKLFKKSPTILNLSKYFKFFPNAVGVDIGNYSSDFTLPPGTLPGNANHNIVGKRVNPGGFDRLLGLVGSLNILYIRPPKRSSGWDYNLLFIPSVYATALTFKYKDLPEIENIEFRRFRAGFGYGPQVSASSRYGTFYGSLLPTVNYTRISWGSDRDKQLETGEFLLLMEIGYQQFVSDSLAFRVFGKTWSENASRWSNIISDAGGKKYPVERSGVTYAGVSIIWYWPGLHEKGLQLLSFD